MPRMPTMSMPLIHPKKTICSPSGMPPSIGKQPHPMRDASASAYDFEDPDLEL